LTILTILTVAGEDLTILTILTVLTVAGDARGQVRRVCSYECSMAAPCDDVQADQGIQQEAE